jgi:ubiquinone/menaquinone biosynthesis C-methylase UbiE
VGVPPQRDVGAFERRAANYESGRLGKMHHEIVDRALELALTLQPQPKHLLDVGCGTGYLLRRAAARLPDAVELVGVDPSQAMIATAEAARTDDRISLLGGIGAEHLPFSEETFDLVTATTSFDHWSDQPAGLAECARVLRGGGRFLLVDRFSLLYAPTMLARPGRARTMRRVNRLLASAGFAEMSWRALYTPLIRAVLATR